MLSVVIVGGLHADARKATVERLLADVPGSVVLHHDLATAAAGTVVRTIRDAGGILSAGETPLVNDCACCALREDLVPELRRLDAAGTLRLAVVELWDSVEPKAMAEVVAAGGLTVTGVITAVDPALVLPYLGNGDDLADRGLAAAATDQRTVADTFARQLEYAPVLAVLDSPEADEEDRELLAQLHPTAHQIPIGTGRPTTTDHATRLTDPSVPDHATRLTDPTNSDHPTRLTDPSVPDHPTRLTDPTNSDHPTRPTDPAIPDHPARPTDPAHTDHATRPTDSTPTDHPVQPTDASGTLYPVRPTDASGTLYPLRPSPRSALARAALAGFDVESAAAAQHPACARLPAEADAHGVSTLVWHRCRPFHPERLYEALEDITCAAARSRGRFWLADKPDVLLHWDAAGGALCVESVGPWLASLPDAAWDMVPPVRRAAAALDWHPEHGDCCQHLVFTSPGLDRDGLERLLESCLLTDAEYAAGRDAWKRLPPAFDTLLEV
ncbi:GTP-binding protein [Streptomyces sp. BK205]|uniref:GTP-binding protein n=1 Tax=Streptomyces sp. BK205 TaxID=2512164 RepID=UPI00104C810A|nr:GTP-binding protein [Streptomyces sp. BK205]TCR11574.1 CobW/HypB/UreG family nucleotide-binding protein [Streptomyces sp. BK205]